MTMMKRMRDEVVDEIFYRIMQAIKDAFYEEGKIIEEAKKFNGLPDGVVIDDIDNSGLILDLIEERVFEAISDTIEDMLEDGEITINENRNSETFKC